MKSDERGFLLAELTVTLALLVVVLAVGFLFYFFCTRSFDDGEKRTLVQSNARLAANFITKEVRYADNISASPIFGEETYYCVKLDGNSLKKETTKEDETQSIQTITRDEYLSGISFRVEKKDNGKVVLIFNIKGNDGTLKKDIKIDSEVLLDNISSTDFNEEIEGKDTIYFTKPDV